MTHEEWIHERVAELLKGLGKIERDMEGEALVSLWCLTNDGAYSASVGSAPPPNINKDVAAAYWETVASGAPISEPTPSEQERVRAAVRRFEEQMAVATRLKPPTS